MLIFSILETYHHMPKGIPVKTIIVIENESLRNLEGDLQTRNMIENESGIVME